MAGNEKDSGEKVSIKDLDAWVMLELCRKLDINQSVGYDYRHLAAKFGMSYENITQISQGQNKTHAVLNWIGLNPKNTVSKLRKILITMKRDDCLAIIDKK